MFLDFEASTRSSLNLTAGFVYVSELGGDDFLCSEDIFRPKMGLLQRVSLLVYAQVGIMLI